MIVGIDPGERRIGVAVADLETRFARPLEVIDRQAVDAIARIAEIIADTQATRLVVGRPVSLAGIDGPAVEAQKTFLDKLRSELDIAIDVHDERMTTVIAERSMRDAGTSAKKRKAQRDAVAASVMLQSYLDAGNP